MINLHLDETAAYVTLTALKNEADRVRHTAIPQAIQQDGGSLWELRLEMLTNKLQTLENTIEDLEAYMRDAGTLI